MEGLKLVEDFVDVHFSSSSEDESLDNHEDEIEGEDMLHDPSLRSDRRIMTVPLREDELRAYTKAMGKLRSKKRNTERRNRIENETYDWSLKPGTIAEVAQDRKLNVRQIF